MRRPQLAVRAAGLRGATITTKDAAVAADLFVSLDISAASKVTTHEIRRP